MKSELIAKYEAEFESNARRDGEWDRAEDLLQLAEAWLGGSMSAGLNGLAQHLANDASLERGETPLRRVVHAWMAIRRARVLLKGGTR